MRSALRLLATPASSRYLQSGNPTGLTGLLTHPSPRANLVVLYTATLSKLKALPAHSSYRAAAEALTKHRLSIVEAVKPEGWDEWNARAQETLKKHPDLFHSRDTSKTRYLRGEIEGKSYVWERLMAERDPDSVEWHNQRPTEEEEGPRAEGVRDLRELQHPRAVDFDEPDPALQEWVPEPKLDASQISEIEEKIGAGLIEEVIEVAEGELDLVDTMLKNKVWEELQDKAPSGQWQYFARDTNVSGTQEPPK